MLFTIMGATGHTGGRIARRLLAEGHRVRAIGRRKGALAALARAGAEALAGDANDPAFLARAFAGADACYVLLAADMSAEDYGAAQDRMGEAVCMALRETRVPRVVALGSLGADQRHHPIGLIARLRRQDERLRRLPGASVCLLRPASFFENVLPQLQVAVHRGSIADAIDADLPIPMVATHDVAEAAVRHLVHDDWRGTVVRELLGPRDLTHTELASIACKALGWPRLRYVRLPYEAMAEALVAVGASASFAHLYVETAHAINARRLEPMRGRTPENTTPTSFEAFMREVAASGAIGGDTAGAARSRA